MTPLREDIDQNKGGGTPAIPLYKKIEAIKKSADALTGEDAGIKTNVNKQMPVYGRR